MKHILISTLIIFISAGINSCTKDPGGSTISSSGQINTITYTSNNSVTGIIKFFYNTDGTVNYRTLSGANSSSYTQKYVYTYTSNEIDLDAYDSLNVHFSKYKIYLKPNGLVDSTVEIPLPTDSILVNHILYNSNNIPTEVQVYKYAPGSAPVNPPGSLFYTFSNGNVMSMTAGNNIYTYDYYNTISNLTPHAYGLPYSLIQSNNLPKTSWFNSVITNSYTYTFDSNNRVATQFIHLYDSNGVDQGQFISYTYSYN